jgi:ferrous iron transport protein A
MVDGELITLTNMRPGHRGTVCEIQGGIGFISRLNGLGIMPGKKIEKISSMVGRGPVTIRVDRVQVAIGFGMASRIMVRPD